MDNDTIIYGMGDGSPITGTGTDSLLIYIPAGLQRAMRVSEVRSRMVKAL